MTARDSLPLEHFIQAVQSQLDNAQTAMAVKARNLDLSLTFAIKDITLDLRAQVEFAQGEIRIRPATAADANASVFHLVFTAITRPMIEENAIALAEDPDDRSIDDLGDELSEEERRRLQWVGVRTVNKLQQIEREGAASTVGRVTSLPVDRLRRALDRAAAPMVEHVTPVGRGAEPDGPALIRVRGRNLARGTLPRVTLAGEAIAVVKATEKELLLAPAPHQWAGELSIEPAPANATALAFDLRSFAPHGPANGDAGSIPGATGASQPARTNGGIA